ncbi:MAG: hypothetical protein IJA55_04850 [Clostridia bacterium]|nr:hypothetical protein [Clostridia bacterium]
MKKRILGFILAVLLVLPTFMFIGCKDEESSLDLVQNGPVPVTLTLYSITEEATTDEARQAVEDEINRITEYEFNTHIILRLFTAEEYKAQVENDLAIAEKNYTEPEVETDENGETVTAALTTPKETLATTKREVETDENGETKHRVVINEEKISYPAENGTQVDIFLVNSLDDYNNYIDNGSIQAMDSELLSSAALIKKYINPTLMNSVATVEGTFGIPNNKLIGDYEYILLRKDLVDKYNYDPSALTTLSRLETYINDVKGEGVTPVLDTYGVAPLAISMTGEDSFFGSHVGYNPAQSNNAMPRNLLTNTSFQKEYSMIRTLKAAGTMVDGELTETPDAACIFAKGSAAIPELYGEDYYVSVYKYPTATNENVFSSVYAVSSYTQSLKRCMQIINYMQTDSELANILRYGVPDEHYTYDEENDIVTVISDEYQMNPEYAGNMFLAYQNTDMTREELTLSADKWALGKQQNLEAVGSPYLSFSPITTDVMFEDEDTMSEFEMTGEEIMAEVIKASDDAEAKLAAFTGTGDALIAYMNTLGQEFAANKAVAAALNNKFTNSAFARYVAWYKVTYDTSTEEA